MDFFYFVPNIKVVLPVNFEKVFALKKMFIPN